MTDLHKLEEDNKVRVDLQLPPILCHHVHDPLHDLCMATGVDREAGWGREVWVLLQGHCLVQVVLNSILYRESHDISRESPE